ncbi:dicarboxylate/amino acid:cation symporter [Sphingomonas sp. SUN039]|uniref:dicarboxylate/amino acid:cation symporter n=1 Tax=Sphingomonas sp. SUN039 TaxID=2937787 RepID=UPI002164628B|nr:dicarboxylate/amino acid:cation symporter [Sphingomonas sp. SUN039]UVO52879.1 dicarboxylate/amino acid:cation symporter [Sphingomonas sp. SUN039]
MSNATRILIALVLGLGLGIGWADLNPTMATQAADYANPIATLWLNALRMTVVPLVFALLVVGIAQSADAARAGRLTARAMIWFVAILWITTIAAALAVPAFLDLWPLSAGAGESLKSALTGTPPPGPVVGIGEFVQSLIPSNPIAAAANDAILPLVVFAAFFAFATLRLPPESRERIVGFMSAVSDAMLVIIGWVLAVAPAGVFLLAFIVGARTGAAAVGAFLHYMLTVSAMGFAVLVSAYFVAVLGARLSLARFAKAASGPQAVAISTQSSLASLPAMLAASKELGVRDGVADVVLPLAVAIFRATSPSMNLAVALYVAHWYGIPVPPAALAAGVAVSAITTMGSVSLPGTLTFFLNIAPVALALGVPIEPLALLVAVETIPDIFRTVGNVTMDVAVTAAVARRVGESEPAPNPG